MFIKRQLSSYRNPKGVETGNLSSEFLKFNGFKVGGDGSTYKQLHKVKNVHLRSPIYLLKLNIK